jgi:hypothetical protein
MSTATEVKAVPQVGDILVSSWGYDQTNIDFYKVVKTTDKSVWIQPIKQRVVEQTHYLSETVVPVDEPAKTYVWDESGQRKEVEVSISRHKIHFYSDTYYVKLTSYSSARPWGGKPEYQSHTH